MYKVALILFLIIGSVACKKDSTPSTALEGKWELIAFTPAPADIPLDWQADNSKSTVKFSNGSYYTSGGSSFSKYIFKDSVIFLFGPNNRDTLKLAVTTLSNTTLQYYVLNGRAAVKSKFKRVR